MQMFGASDAANVRGNLALSWPAASSMPFSDPSAPLPTTSPFQTALSRNTLAADADAGLLRGAENEAVASDTPEQSDQVLVFFGASPAGVSSEVPQATSSGPVFTTTGAGQAEARPDSAGAQSSTVTQTDLSAVLLDLKMPASESRLEQARVLVEHGIPLTRENLQELNHVLSALPQAPTEHDLSAAVLLKTSGQALTPESLSVLAGFLASQPLLGNQLTQIDKLLKRFRQRLEEAHGEGVGDELDRLPGMLGALSVQPTGSRRPSTRAALQQLALQVGLDQRSGQSEEAQQDYVEWLRFLCDHLADLNSTEVAAASLRDALLELADNLQAQALLNAAALEQASGYLQIPLQPQATTAQACLIYHQEGHVPVGEGAAPAQLELTVPTEYLGELHYRLTLEGSRVHVEILVGDDETREHVMTHVADLVDNLERIGYHVPTLACRVEEAQTTLQPSSLLASLLPPKQCGKRIDVSA